MDVFCLVPCKRKLPSGAEVTHPKDWSGDVPEADALRWIGERKATRIGAVLQPGQQFTADQAAVLAYVADEAIRQAIEANQAGEPAADLVATDEDVITEYVDPETGEVREIAGLADNEPEVVELDEAGAEVAAEAPLKIEELSTADLRELAKLQGVPRASNLGREKLIAALAALKAA